jgi:hypothetical protein
LNEYVKKNCAGHAAVTMLFDGEKGIIVSVLNARIAAYYFKGITKVLATQTGLFGLRSG